MCSAAVAHPENQYGRKFGFVSAYGSFSTNRWLIFRRMFHFQFVFMQSTMTIRSQYETAAQRSRQKKQTLANVLVGHAHVCVCVAMLILESVNFVSHRFCSRRKKGKSRLDIVSKML